MLSNFFHSEVCMHFSLNSAPCRPVQPLDFIKLLIFGVFRTLLPLNKGFALKEIIFEEPLLLIFEKMETELLENPHNSRIVAL